MPFLAFFQAKQLLLKTFRQGGVAETKQGGFAVIAGGFSRGAIIQFQREMNETALLLCTDLDMQIARLF